MADIDTIRTPGNWSDLYLLVDAPSTIYTARASGAILQSDWTLGFDGGSGTLTNCLENMPVLIGSTSGAADIGVARLRRSAAGGDTKFYLGADPSLVVADNDYLTVLNDFPLWAKHPVGTALDVDLAYSDQFTSFIPTPWMNGRVRVIRAGETTGFDASRSQALGSSISSYAWTFTGATSTTGTTSATPTATYNTSGRYRVKLTVTAANGKSASAWAWVYVLGPNLAAEADVSVDNIDVGDQAGGRVRVRMFDRPEIQDGARAVLFSDDYYQGVRGSFGPAAYAKNIRMCGWIVTESIIRDPRTDQVEFEIVGPIESTGNLAMLPSGLVDQSYPEDNAADLPAWSKIAGLTVAKGLHYLIHYRSNLAEIADVSVEDFGWLAPKLTGGSENLYGQLSDFAGRAALGVHADRLGRIYIERDTQLLPIASRAGITNVMTMTDQDWQGELTVVRRQRGEIALAEAEGGIYSGGTLAPAGGRSPGDIPARWGDKDDLNEVYTNTQAEMLELAGLLGGAKNTEIEAVLGVLAYNNPLMDVAPRQFLTVDVDGQALKCIPRRMTTRRNPETGFMHTELELEPEGNQWPAVSIEYPGEGSQPAEPPTEPPTEPPVPPEGEGEEEEEPTGTDAIVATPGDVQTTADLDQASPTWVTEL
jgi:PKD repeat protein